MGNVDLNAISNAANSVAERNAIKGALNGNVYPRRPDGEVRDQAASLGSADINWHTLYARNVITDSLTVAGAAGAVNKQIYEFGASANFQWPVASATALAFIAGGGGGGGSGAVFNVDPPGPGGDSSPGLRGGDGGETTLTYGGAVIARVPGGHGGGPGTLSDLGLVGPNAPPALGAFAQDFLSAVGRLLGFGSESRGNYPASQLVLGPNPGGGTGVAPVIGFANGGDGAGGTADSGGAPSGGAGVQYGRWQRLTGLAEGTALVIDIGAGGAGAPETVTNASRGGAGENGAPGFVVIIA